METNTEKNVQKSRLTDKILAKMTELRKESEDSNKLTKEKVEEYRKKNYYGYNGENMKQCTEYVGGKGLKLPICSNSGQSLESRCHLNCDKEFVTPLMKGEFVGKCNDPRKYPMKLHEDYEYQYYMDII